jgi:hypothetical protein
MNDQGRPLKGEMASPISVYTVCLTLELILTIMKKETIIFYLFIEVK